MAAPNEPKAEIWILQAAGRGARQCGTWGPPPLSTGLPPAAASTQWRAHPACRASSRRAFVVFFENKHWVLIGENRLEHGGKALLIAHFGVTTVSSQIYFLGGLHLSPYIAF